MFDVVGIGLKAVDYLIAAAEVEAHDFANTYFIANR